MAKEASALLVAKRKVDCIGAELPVERGIARDKHRAFKGENALVRTSDQLGATIVQNAIDAANIVHAVDNRLLEAKCAGARRR